MRIQRYVIVEFSVSPFIFSLIVKYCRYFKQRARAAGGSKPKEGGANTEEEMELELGEIKLEEYIDVEDFIKANERVSNSERGYRIFASYLIFILVLAISSIAAFFLVVLRYALPRLLVFYTNPSTVLHKKSKTSTHPLCCFLP